MYSTSGYEASVRNLAGITLATDNVFSDGSALGLATMTDSVSAGYKAALTVAVDGGGRRCLTTRRVFAADLSLGVSTG